MARDIFAQLFLDVGNGFNEEDSIRREIGYGHIDLEFEIDANESIESIRFDPANIPCIISDFKITYKSDEKEKEAHYYLMCEGITEDNHLIFFHSDPILGFEWVANSKVKSIQIEFNIADAVDILSDFRKIISRHTADSFDNRMEKLLKIIKSVDGQISNFEGELNYQQSLVRKVSLKTQSLDSVEKMSQQLTEFLNEIPNQKAVRIVEDIKTRLAVTEEKLSTKITQIKDLNKTIADQKKKIASLEKILQSQSLESEKISVKDYKEKEKLIHKLSVDLDVLKRENNSLKRRIRALEKSKEKYKEEQTKKKILLETTQSENQKQFDKTVAELNILKEEKETLNNRIHQLSETQEKYDRLLNELHYIAKES